MRLDSKSPGLLESFVENYPHGRRQIETANLWIPYRNCEASLPIQAQNLIGQATRFSSKNQTIVWAKVPIGIVLVSLCSQIQEASFRQRFVKVLEAGMPLEYHLRPII